MTDAYGNLPAPTQISLTSDKGVLDPIQALSVGGQVTTTLDLPTFAHGSVSITATASSAVSTTVTIPLIEKHYMAAVFENFDAATAAASTP